MKQNVPCSTFSNTDFRSICKKERTKDPQLELCGKTSLRIKRIEGITSKPPLLFLHSTSPYRTLDHQNEEVRPVYLTYYEIKVLPAKIFEVMSFHCIYKRCHSIILSFLVSTKQGAKPEVEENVKHAEPNIKSWNRELQDPL